MILKQHEIIFHRKIKDQEEAIRLFNEAFIDEVTKIYNPDCESYWKKCPTSTGNFIVQLKNLNP